LSQPQSLPQVKKPSYKGLIVGIILVAVVLAILFIPMIPVDTTYNSTEPYDRLATYQVGSATTTAGFDLTRGVYQTVAVDITNTDSYGGTFTVELSLYTIDGLFGTQSPSAYIGPGQSHTFSAQFDTSIGQNVRGEYSVTAPTVIDNQVVLRHRTDYKSIIELVFYH
jgi:hypothetical protein